MRYCKRCLQPDTRPNTFFSSDGICPACNYFEQLQCVDWKDRYEILQDLIAKYVQKSLINYDCIIGVSGGKDSTRQALYLRDKLGLRPLLVCLSYPPEQVTERGMENLSNLINLGFDVIVSSPAPPTWKKLKKKGFEIFSNSFRSTEMALFSSVPQIAIKYGIKLIFWGENPGLQLGDLKVLGRTGYDGNGLRNLNTLSSGIDWMLEAGLPESKIIPYSYPTPKEFEDYDLQIIYLGWFLGDWSLINNALYSVVNGLKIRKKGIERVGDYFGVTALDEDFTPITQLIKYYKFGFGRATDYVNEEIRLGRLSRNEGIRLVEEHDGQCNIQYLQKYCEYLEINEEEFWSSVLPAINKKLFIVKNKNNIIPRFKVGSGL